MKNLSFIKTKIHEFTNRNLEIRSTLKMAGPSDWFCRQKTEDSVTSCQNDQRGERVPSKNTGQPLPGEFHATNKRANITTHCLEERLPEGGGGGLEQRVCEGLLGVAHSHFMQKTLWGLQAGQRDGGVGEADYQVVTITTHTSPEAEVCTQGDVGPEPEPRRLSRNQTHRSPPL